MRSFALAALAALVLSPAALAGAPPSASRWSGEMRQIEVNAEAKYPMTLTLSGKKGTATYPTLNCSGTWTRIAVKDGYQIYQEKVTNQKGATCIDGIAMVRLDGDKLILGWFAADQGEPFLAEAMLSREAK